MAFSPLGRRSGAHLNPAVTIGLWLQKVTGRADLAGDRAAQIIGGIAGVAAARTWGPQVAGATVHWAVIAPAARMNEAVAAAVEAGATFAQLVLVFGVLASRRYHQWAPVVAGVMLTAFIVALAPVSGAGFNPVRGLAPDVLANAYPAIWIYFACRSPEVRQRQRPLSPGEGDLSPASFTMTRRSAATCVARYHTGP